MRVGRRNSFLSLETILRSFQGRVELDVLRLEITQISRYRRELLRGLPGERRQTIVKSSQGSCCVQSSIHQCPNNDYWAWRLLGLALVYGSFPFISLPFPFVFVVGTSITLHTFLRYHDLFGCIYSVIVRHLGCPRLRASYNRARMGRVAGYP